jgi:hypothetical protein
MLVIELISIIVLTFALALIVLGAITAWLERGQGRLQGIILAVVGLLVGAAYGFLGSRFSEVLFGRLIVLVDLPTLMLTALIYTGGVVGGTVLAVSIFLWATGRFGRSVTRTVTALVILAVLVALVTTFLAIVLSAR